MLWKMLRSADHAILFLFEKFADLVVLSLLWVVCSIPIVTAVPAASALYYAVVKSVRRDCGKAAAEFFHSFRSNLRQGIGLSVIVAAAALILAGNLALVERMPQGASQKVFFAVFLRCLGLFLTAFSLYLGPVLSRFSKNTGNTVRFTAALMLRHLGTTVSVFCMAAAVATAIWFYWIALIVLPGILALCSSFSLERVFKKYMEPPAQDTPPNQLPWYWQ